MYRYPCAFNGWGSEEDQAIEWIRTCNRWTMGPEVKKFEGDFAKYHNRKHAIMVNSGSSANLISVAALFAKKDKPLEHGDEASVPALAWATTYAPLVQHGMELRLLDVDNTWNAAPAPITGSRLIVGCSVLGNPAHLRYWQLEAKRLGAYFLEDNCESIGAVAGGDPDALCGTFGDLSTFSFFWSHQLSAIEGGMILTDDDELAGLCRMLRDHGMTRSLRPADRFEDEYDFRLMGYNVRPLELHAAIASEQLKKLNEGRKWRVKNYETFRSMSAHLPIKMARDNGNLNPFGIHFTCSDVETRRRVVYALRKNSIDCRLPTGGSFLKHEYGENWDLQSTPMANRIHDTGLFIGNAPFDLYSLIEEAVRVMDEAMRRRAA